MQHPACSFKRRKCRTGGFFELHKHRAVLLGPKIIAPSLVSRPKNATLSLCSQKVKTQDLVFAFRAKPTGLSPVLSSKPNPLSTFQAPKTRPLRVKSQHRGAARDPVCDVVGGAGRERCPPTTPYPVDGKCLGTGMEAPSLHGGRRPVSLWGSAGRRGGESLY